MPRQRPLSPLNPKQLQSLALFYVGKYATTTGKLKDYLRRKVRERGWDGDDAPDFAGIVQRMADLHYVDDAAYAEAKAASMQRRGYGPRRVQAALAAAGVKGEDVDQPEREELERCALILARRKRIGPFAAVKADRAQEARWAAALMRGGHTPDVVRSVLSLSPEEADARLA
jgi:regulatory protein